MINFLLKGSFDFNIHFVSVLSFCKDKSLLRIGIIYFISPKFVNWTENGSEVSTSNTYRFTVIENKNLVANLELIEYNIIASVNPSEGGQILGMGIYYYDSVATLKAIPTEGYEFINWSENGTEVSTNVNYSFTVTTNRNVVANFELIEYNIEASVNPPEGGQILGIGTYYYDSIAELTIIPNNSYKFINWTENGTEVSTDTIYNFIVYGNKALVANLETVSVISIQPRESLSNLVYPNPVKNYLIIEWDNFRYATIMDISGQCLIEESTELLNLSNLKSGLYILTLHGNRDQVIQYKIIKE